MRPALPITHLTQVMPLLAGGCAGVLLASVGALLLDANLSDGVEIATIAPSIANCAAVGSLIARCITR